MEPPRHRAEGARPRGKGRIEPLESSFRRLEASFRRSFTRRRAPPSLPRGIIHASGHH